MKIKLPQMYRCYRILGWDFTITPARVVLLLLVAFMGCVALTRLLTGFRYITNLTDETPWGLWISFDVLCGVALAGGGYPFVGDIVIVFHHLVDDAVGCKFDYAVAHGLDKLVVVTRHQDDALKRLQRVVECLN